MNKLFLLIIVLIFCTGLFVQITNPRSLYWDELAIGIDAYSVAHTGRDIHGNSFLQAIYPSYGDYKAPVPIIITSMFVSLFGLHEWSVVLPFFIVMWCGIGALLWLMIQVLGVLQKKSNIDCALLSVIVMSLTPWILHFSHIGFESGMSFSFLVMSMAFVTWGLRTRGYGILIGTFFGTLSVYTYFSARILFPMFALALCLGLYKLCIAKWRWILAAGVCFILGMLPLYNSPFYAQSEQYRWSAENIVSDGKAVSASAEIIASQGNSILSRVLNHRYWFILKSFLQNYQTHFSADFLLLKGDPNLRHHSGWGGQLSPVSFVLMLFGLYRIAVHYRQSVCYTIILWLLIAPLTASIPYEVPHASRGIYMLLPVSLLVLLGIVQLFDMLHTPGIRKAKLLFAIILFITFLNASLYAEDYLNHYPQRSIDAWQLKNREMAVAAIGEGEKYEQIFISDAYRLPSLSVLFYKPELIAEIQPNQRHTSNQSYTWIAEFGKYRFGNVSSVTVHDSSLILQ